LYISIGMIAHRPFKANIILSFSRYTSKKSAEGGLSVYAILLQWPDPGDFYLSAPTPTPDTRVSLLGYQGQVTWSKTPKPRGLNVNIPIIPFNKMPCQYAWVFKFENLA